MKSDSPLSMLKIAVVSLLLQSCRPAGPPPEKTPGNTENPPSVRDFEFRGGGPREFVEALDKDFGSAIGKMVNISRAAESLHLGSFRVRTADPIGAIIALQRFSAGDGGRFGNWQVMTADGSPASRLESASSILVTPGDFTSGEATVDTMDRQTPQTGKCGMEAGILDLRLQVVALKRVLAELQLASGFNQPGHVAPPLQTPEVRSPPPETAQPSEKAE